MMIRSAFAAIVFVATALLPSAGIARTEAILHVDAPGRAGAARHRLVLTDVVRITDKVLDVMLVISCRAASPEDIGLAVDFGNNARWDIDGHDVTLAVDGVELPARRFASAEDLLVIGGAVVAADLRRVLAGTDIEIRAADAVARFRLADVRERVERFRTLCKLL